MRRLILTFIFVILMVNAATAQDVVNPLVVEAAFSLDGVTWFDADRQIGQIISAGLPLSYRIEVKNQGDAPITELSLTNFSLDLSGCAVPQTLNAGESYTCTLPALTSVEGAFGTLLYAGATYNGQFISASDNSYYFGGQELLRNGGFEYRHKLKNLPTGWWPHNLSKDRRVCNTAARLVAYAGNCALRFIGVPKERGIMRQKLRQADVRALSSSNAVVLTAAVKGDVQGRGLRINAVIFYRDNNTAKKTRISLFFSSGVFTDYVFVATQPVALPDQIKKVSLWIRSSGPAGVVLVDEVHLLRITATENMSRSSIPMIVYP